MRYFISVIFVLFVSSCIKKKAQCDCTSPYYLSVVIKDTIPTSIDSIYIYIYKKGSSYSNLIDSVSYGSNLKHKIKIDSLGVKNYSCKLEHILPTDNDYRVYLKKWHRNNKISDIEERKTTMDCETLTSYGVTGCTGDVDGWKIDGTRFGNQDYCIYLTK